MHGCANQGVPFNFAVGIREDFNILEVARARGVPMERGIRMVAISCLSGLAMSDKR